MISKKTSIIVGIALVIISFFAGIYFSSFKKTYEIKGYYLIEGNSTTCDCTAIVYDNWVEINYENGDSIVIPRDNVSGLIGVNRGKNNDTEDN